MSLKCGHEMRQSVNNNIRATERTEGLERLKYLIHIEFMKINKGLYVPNRIWRIVLHALLECQRLQQSTCPGTFHPSAGSLYHR